MRLDLDVGREDEQRLQILNVLFDALGFMAVGPCHDNIRSMAFLEAVPFLIAEDVEIERVEYLEIFLHPRDLLLMRRWWGRRVFSQGLGVCRWAQPSQQHE